MLVGLIMIASGTTAGLIDAGRGMQMVVALAIRAPRTGKLVNVCLIQDTGAGTLDPQTGGVHAEPQEVLPGLGKCDGGGADRGPRRRKRQERLKAVVG